METRRCMCQKQWLRCMHISQVPFKSWRNAESTLISGVTSEMIWSFIYHNFVRSIWKAILRTQEHCLMWWFWLLRLISSSLIESGSSFTLPCFKNSRWTSMKCHIIFWKHLRRFALKTMMKSYMLQMDLV